MSIKRRDEFVFIYVFFSFIIFVFFQNCSPNQQENIIASTEFSQIDENFTDVRFQNEENQAQALTTLPTIPTAMLKGITVRSGDIIGFYMKFSPMIISVTGSYFDHVGIIMVEGGSPYLYQSMPDKGWHKVLLSDTSSYLNSYLITLVRYNSLTLSQHDTLSMNLKNLVAYQSGKPSLYHHDYLSEYSADLNKLETPKGCSEFVRYAFYKSAIPSSTSPFGAIELVSSLANGITRGTVSGELFNAHLIKYGLASKSYYVVTPASILNDSRLSSIYTSLPFGGFLSEAEALGATSYVIGSTKYNTRLTSKMPASNFRQTRITPSTWTTYIPALAPNSKNCTVPTGIESLLCNSSYYINGLSATNMASHLSSCKIIKSSTYPELVNHYYQCLNSAWQAQ